MEVILNSKLCILDREVKPMIVAVGISVVLDEQCVSVRLFFVLKCAKEIAAFEPGVEL